MKKPEIPPALTMILAAALLGTSGLFIKAVEMSALHITLIRSAVPTIYLGLIFFFRKSSLFTRLSPFLFLGSLLNALRLFFFFTGYQLTTMGNATAVFYSWPLFAHLLSFLLLKEKMRLRKILFLLLAFGGILLIYSTSGFSFTNQDFAGMASVTLAAFLYALSIIAFKKVSQGYDRLEITFFQNFLSTLIYLPSLFLITPLPGIRDLGIITVYGIIIGIGAFSLFFTALRHLPASRASHLSYMEVVSAIALALAVRGEIPAPAMIAGTALLLISLAGMTREE